VSSTRLLPKWQRILCELPPGMMRIVNRGCREFLPNALVPPTTKTMEVFSGLHKSCRGAPVRKIRNAALTNRRLSRAFPPHVQLFQFLCHKFQPVIRTRIIRRPVFHKQISQNMHYLFRSDLMAGPESCPLPPRQVWLSQDSSPSRPVSVGYFSVPDLSIT